MAAEASEAQQPKATKSRLTASPERSTSVGLVQETGGSLSGHGSLADSVTDGLEQWWHKSSVGRAVDLFGPVVEPYLRPVVRQHYKALLLGSAAVGALVSRYPVRSVRTVMRVAGPMLLLSMVFEISKAGLRQVRGHSSPPIDTSD